MSLTRRLQVLIDDERYERLEREAERRQVAVAVLVRDAIDARYPGDHDLRAKAALRILEADTMDVPDDPRRLRTELDSRHGRWE